MTEMRCRHAMGMPSSSFTFFRIGATRKGRDCSHEHDSCTYLSITWQPGMVQDSSLRRAAKPPRRFRLLSCHSFARALTSCPANHRSICSSKFGSWKNVPLHHLLDLQCCSRLAHPGTGRGGLAESQVAYHIRSNINQCNLPDEVLHEMDQISMRTLFFASPWTC